MAGTCVHDLGVEKALTVRELIEKLSALPPDDYVHAEGCDCSAFAAAVERNDQTVDDFDAEKYGARKGANVHLIGRVSDR